MNKRLILSISNLIALLCTLFVNYLANALPINGQTTGAVSDKFEVLFKPAGYVFSIWGLIYLSLFIFIIYQLLPALRKTDLIDKISFYFIISCLANIAWLFAWHYERFLVTVVLMLVLLTSLITLYLQLNIRATKVSAGRRWCVEVPFSLYLAWISVATIANITILLSALGWSGFGITETIWFIVVLILGLILSFVVVYKRRDFIFSLVILWAYLGITVNNSGIKFVSTVSWIASAFALGIVLFNIVQFKRG